MISNRWMERRQPHWDRLKSLLAQARAGGLKALTPEQLRELAFLYRQIASDLSALRQDGTAPILERSLNATLAQAHSLLYSGRRPGLVPVARFLWTGFPLAVRKLLPFVEASLLLFLSGGLLGTLLTLARPEFMRHMLGPSMLQSIDRHQMWTHSINSMAPQMSSAIMTNNIAVTFMTFASGIVAGLGPLFLIGWNGVLIGVVAVACHHAGMSVSLWSFIAAHGSLELPAIILAGAAGLRIGQGLLFPGAYSRRHSLAAAGQDAVRIMAGVVPMLVIAGLLEAFLSPTGAPVALKFTLGGVLFTTLLLWLFHPVPETPTNA